MSITINGATNTISSTGTVTLPTVAGVTSLGNTALGDAEASDTHAIKGATTLLANSASAALTVTQTGAGNAFVVEDSASTDSTPFVIDAAGRTLIGHTATVAGTFGTQAPLQNLSFGTTTTGRFFNDASAPALDFIKSRNSTIGSHTVVQSGDALADLYFSGSDGTAFIRAAQITAAVDGTPGSNDMPGRLIFSTTADGASSPTERMRIDSAGNVGIGATSASISLRVAKSVTGGTIAYGVVANGQVQTDVTVGSYGFASLPSFANYAAAQHKHFDAAQGTISGTLTDQKAFSADSSLTGATNNYGFYSNIAAATGRWNFYASGTAANYFGGNVTVGGGGTLGYGAGSGGTVTQASTRTTGVTLNKPSGDITLVSDAGSATYQSLTVTNSAVAATDSISCSQKSGTDLYEIHTTNVAAGSFRITYRTTGGTTTEQPVFHFNVIKGAAS